MLIVRESSYNTLREECVRLQNENAKLRTEVEAAQNAAALAYRIAAPRVEAPSAKEEESTCVMPYDEFREFLNPEPQDSEVRAGYMAQIAGYFNGGLKDELQHIASSFKNELARFPVTEREADFYRASINVCYLLLEWGERCVSEHFANIAGARGTTDVFNEPQDEAVEKIKKQLSN